MSSSTDLRVAEMIHAGEKYNDIRKQLHVGSDAIKKVKDWMLEGIIAVDAEGKAHLAKPAQKEIEEIHAEVMEVVTKKASETALKNAEDDYALGNEVRQNWSIKAQELGMDLRDFVRGALIFYDEYRDAIEEMMRKQEIARWAIGELRRNTTRIAKMELFYKFVRYCIYVRSQGLSVPDSVLNDFYSDLTVLEAGGELKTEGKIEVIGNV